MVRIRTRLALFFTVIVGDENLELKIAIGRSNSQKSVKRKRVEEKQRVIIDTYTFSFD